MIKKTALMVSAMALAGCASGGSGGGTTSGSTMFSSPEVISKESFEKDPKKYSKSWVSYKGGGVDSFKKVTIPSYTLEVRTDMQGRGYNKMAALLVKGDGAKSALFMNVSFPWEQHQAMLQEVATISYGRLKEKFKKAGAEVVEWSSVVSSNEKAADFNKERLSMTPVEKGENMVSLTANGQARLLPGMWVYAASSLSRDAEIALIFPNFGLGFGYFDGEDTPLTITEAHGMGSIKFTPQAQVLTGSGFGYQSKWHTGTMALDRTAVSNEPFVKKLVKGDDTREAANQRGEAKRGLTMALHGAQAHEVAVSTNANLQYQLEIDPVKYKAMLLSQLDAAEDLLVERYKNEF
ncbi:MAG: hypothetical protein KF802_13145 [Bdellovibrionaceae bacterium]|nr:hypothetical protein [Pseudobdellovibrionaceae bacterium]